MNDCFALVRDHELRDYIEALYTVIASEDRDEEPYCTLTRAAEFLIELREKHNSGRGR